MSSPRAVLFDAYGTLFDVFSVQALADELFPGHGERLAQVWRDKQIEYSRLVSMAGPARYQPFWDLTRAGLRFAALRLKLPLSDAAEARLMDQYKALRPFAENHAVLLELQRRGVCAGVLSNGSPEMLAAAVASAGFGALLGPVLSVHPARRYKTDPAAYALGTAALQMPARDILFVSSNAWDAVGATWFGYTTLWIDRSAPGMDIPMDTLGTSPHHVGKSLADVLLHFPAA
jgi:2-haloacid dehalogenase